MRGKHEKCIGLCSILLIISIVNMLVTSVNLIQVEAKEEYQEIISVEEFYDTVIGHVSNLDSSFEIKFSFPPSTIEYGVLHNKLVDAFGEFRGNNCYGYTYKIEGSDGNLVCYKFTLVYYSNDFNYDKVMKRAKKIADYMSKKNLTDFEKIKATHDYLINNCEYYINGRGADAVFFGGKAACNGYGMAFQIIMDYANIPCTIEIGGGHMWNKVKLDGIWYNIDLTWDDPGKTGVVYDYFLKADKDWEEHQHGGASAVTSYNNFDESWNFEFPPYNVYEFISFGVKITIGILIMVFVCKIKIIKK